MKASFTIWESSELDGEHVWLWREIDVDQVMLGVARLGISFGYGDGIAEQAIGADLTPAECRKLACLLEAAAISAETGGAA